MIREFLAQIVQQERADSASRPMATTNTIMSANASDEMTSPERPADEMAGPGHGPEPPAPATPPAASELAVESMNTPSEPTHEVSTTSPPQADASSLAPVGEVGAPGTGPAPPQEAPVTPQGELAPPQDMSPPAAADPIVEPPQPPEERPSEPGQRPAPAEFAADVDPVSAIRSPHAEAQFIPLGEWNELFEDGEGIEELEQSTASDLGFETDLQQRRVD